MPFDPDAYLATKAQETPNSGTGAFDPDAYLAQRDGQRAQPAPGRAFPPPGSPPDEFPGDPMPPPAPQPSVGDNIVGAGEAALTVGTGLASAPAAYAMGLPAGMLEAATSPNVHFGTPEYTQVLQDRIAQVLEGMTYAPRTAAGQQQAGAVGDALAPLVALGPVAPGIGPMATELGAASQSAQALPMALRATAGPAAATVQRAMSEGAQRVAGAAQQGVGAVTSGVRSLMGDEPAAAPGFGAQSVGAAAGPVVSQRVATAENLPVPVTLTRGAATRDAAQLAFEKEQLKSALGGPLRNRAEENNLQTLENFDALIDDTGARTPMIGPQATGQSVTHALSEGLEAAKNRVRVAYRRAEQSPEADALVDATPLVEHLNGQPAGLGTTALTDHARQWAQRLGVVVDDGQGGLRPGSANVRTMERLRKEINQATGFEPAQIHQSTVLKGLIDAATEPVAGPLYREARRARQQMAQRFEDRAVIARLVSNRKGMSDPQVAADQVFRRSILNESPREILRLKRMLLTGGGGRNAQLRANGAQAWREIQGSLIQHIKDEATKNVGMDSAGNPLVSPAQLHRVVTSLDKNGRLDMVLGTQHARIVRDLNDVVRFVNTVPPGTLVNSSGTAGVLLAALAEAGVSGTITGMPVPLVTGLRFVMKLRKERATQARIVDALNALPPAPRVALRRAALSRPAASTPPRTP